MMRVKATQLKKEIVAEKGQDEFEIMLEHHQVAVPEDEDGQPGQADAAKPEDAKKEDEDKAAKKGEGD